MDDTPYRGSGSSINSGCERSANAADCERPDLAGLYLKSQAFPGLQSVDVLGVQIGLRADVHELVERPMDEVDERQNCAVAE